MVGPLRFVCSMERWMCYQVLYSVPSVVFNRMVGELPSVLFEASASWTPSVVFYVRAEGYQVCFLMKGGVGDQDCIQCKTTGRIPVLKIEFRVVCRTSVEH